MKRTIILTLLVAQFAENTAFVLEFGGINHFLAGGDKKSLDYFSKSSPVLTIGYRSFRR